MTKMSVRLDLQWPNVVGSWDWVDGGWWFAVVPPCEFVISSKQRGASAGGSSLETC